MPHDLNGTQVQKGDTVVVRCKVVDVYQADEFCNASLETELPMYPSPHKTAITLNTRQFAVEDGQPHGEV